MNVAIFSICMFAMLMAPTIAICQNQQINRLTIMTALLILVKSRFKFKLELHHWLFIAFVVWCGICSIYSTNPFISFYGFYPYRGDGFLTLLVLTAFGYLYWRAFKSIKIMAVLSFIAIIVLIIARIIIVKMTPESPEVSAIYFQRFFIPDVALSSFVSHCSLLCGPAGLLGLIPCIDVQSRSGVAAIVLTLLPFLIWKYRAKINFKLVAVAVMVVVVGIAFCLKTHNKVLKFPSLSSEGARPQWLKQSIELSKSLPLTGYGLDNLGSVLKKPTGVQNYDLQRFIADRTHNIAFDFILMTGWTGFGIILFCFGYCMKAAWVNPTNQNIVLSLILISHIIFGFMNPHGAMGNLMAIFAIFGIRKTNDLH